MRLNSILQFQLDSPVIGAKRVCAGVLPDSDGYAGLFREYTHGGPTELWRVRFDAAGRQTWHERTGISAEDPRIFRWNGKLMALAWDYPPHSRPDWQHLLIDADEGMIQAILRMENRGDFRGKNWTPVVGGKDLLIIRSLDPLWVMKPDLETGRCIDLVANRGEIGPYRGGSLGTIKGDYIHGFGHKTESADVHTVFAYAVDMNNWTVRFDPVIMPDGFNAGVNDPIAAWDGHVVCCSTPRTWAENDWVQHHLMSVGD